MSEWMKTKLGDIAELHYGKGLSLEHRLLGSVPVYSSAGLTGFHNSALCDSEGLIIGRKGTVGKVYYSKVPFWCIDTAYYIKPNVEKYNLNYLYYLIQTLGLEELNEDSAVPGLNRNTAYQQQFLFPHLEAQSAIASVLSSLDDKIDLLHRQNKTLDTMAETLFRQWFVEEAKEDWEEVRLSSLARHLTQNVHPASKPSEMYAHYSLPAFDAGMTPVRELGSQILSNKYAVESHSILVSKLNPGVPRIWPIGDMRNQNAICSTEFQVFKPYSDSLFAYVYYLLKSPLARDELMMAASGTSGSHQRVRPADIGNLKCTFPSIDRAKEFSHLVSTSMAQCAENLVQISTLEKLRDTLLPKLMSGEVRVKYD